uniref:NTP-PPase-like protein n=1 Tax=Siphoviridae sp. ctfYP22 TaxID=2827584 RepID=A0A8S5LIG2_9CAUD|nr:MAG TPA: NTP-PPase-like protein [Siphoviridae sp. ctfYP22]
MTYRLYNADTLKRYAKDFHQRAVAKGFWDVPHSVGHYLMLAYGELHEAIEADRLGKWAKLDPDTIDTLQRIEGEPYAKEFLREVKGRVEDKIADAVVRLLDLLGDFIDRHGLPEWKVNYGIDLYGEDGIPPMLTDALVPIVTDLCIADEKCDPTFGFLNSIKSLELLCAHLGIDLMTHIELKLKYNETRPAKHGKKY